MENNQFKQEKELETIEYRINKSNKKLLTIHLKKWKNINKSLK